MYSSSNNEYVKILQENYNKDVEIPYIILKMGIWTYIFSEVVYGFISLLHYKLHHMTFVCLWLSIRLCLFDLVKLMIIIESVFLSKEKIFACRTTKMPKAGLEK